MKKWFTLSFLLFSFTISMPGQENTLSLDIKAGGLEAAIEQEHWGKVQALTLTGSMNDADFYFIRDRLRTLRKLDIKNVQVDTIPVKALHKHENMNEVILPEEVKYIGDSALYTVVWRTVVTGKFPQLGVRSVGYVIVSEDNEYCKAVDDLICSLDGKILYFANYPMEIILPEGIEHISSRAFDHAPIIEIVFPSTLKSIAENAFSNIEGEFPFSLKLVKNAFSQASNIEITNYPYEIKNNFIFTSSIPPKLLGNVFTDEVFLFFKLLVPNEESIKLYEEADSQWCHFQDGTIYLVNEAQLKLNIQAGSLITAITKERREKVRELTLMGSMNNSDFYFIKDSLPNVEKIDIKKIKVDSIPAKAFCKKWNIKKIILPSEIKYIGDSACYGNGEKIVTGVFPELGVASFCHKLDFVTVSDNNPYCKSDDEIIYSRDGKILFWGKYTIDDFLPEGVERIASRAFEDSYVITLKFPTSLKCIEENAFSNIQRGGINSISYSHNIENHFTFNSATPPELLGDVFTDEVFSKFKLIVPGEESVQLYKNADPQWSNFNKGIIHPSKISFKTKNKLLVSRHGDSWILKNELCIKKIEAFNFLGIICYNRVFNNREIEIENEQLQKANILKITYVNGEIETIKLRQ